MKGFKQVLMGILFTLGILILVSGCSKVVDPLQPQSEESLAFQNGDPIPGQYIVVLGDANQGFSKAAAVEQTARDIMIDNGVTSYSLKYIYHNSIAGFTVYMDHDQDVLKLKKDSRIRYIEQDRFIVLKKPGGKPGGGGGSQGQVTPWGITRVGGPLDGSGKTAWIIDTGIDLDHPDLNVDASRGYSVFTNGPDASPDDNNGHGTHVAGIVAALNNNIDVVGVAAGATVVPVKVLDRRGSGSYSGVIAGVDYVAANASPGDAANMSLGGPVSTALDQAVLNAASKGIKFAIAAGNESQDANNSSPARVNHQNVFTISAIDQNDVFASFSNYGNPPVDYAAPGVSIFSLYKGGGTTTMSGTSMASPHVCGLLLMGSIHSDGFAVGDPDGNPDPIAHH
jgi:subtilisin family serine protease